MEFYETLDLDDYIKMPQMLAFESRAQAGKDFRQTGAPHSWLGKALLQEAITV